MKERVQSFSKRFQALRTQNITANHDDMRVLFEELHMSDDILSSNARYPQKYEAYCISNEPVEGFRMVDLILEMIDTLAHKHGIVRSAIEYSSKDDEQTSDPNARA